MLLLNDNYIKDHAKILSSVTYVLILGSVSILLNELREFDFEQFKEFQSWAKTADKNASWWTSENALRWSYYVISAGLFFWRAYLIYGFTYFLSILNEIKKGKYFSSKNIASFKKVGNIFIGYAINVFVLRMILAYVQGNNFKAMQQLKEDFIILVPAGLAFYILAELFKQARANQEDSELTI